MAFDLNKIDLGAVDRDEEEPNYLRTNFSEALKVNPVEHVEKTRLSEETGVPVEAVDETTKHQFNLNKIDFNAVVKDSPATANFLKDFNKSIVAQNDVENMRGIEGLLNGPVTADTPVVTKSVFDTMQSRALDGLKTADLKRTIDVPPEEGQLFVPGEMSPEQLPESLKTLDPRKLTLQESIKKTVIPSDIGRLETAGSQFVRGAGSVVTSIPKTLTVEATENVRQTLLGTDEGATLLMRAESGDPLALLTLDEFNRAFDPREAAGYKAAERIDEFIENTFEVNPEYAEEFITGKVPQGLGSAVGFIATTLLTRGTGVLGGAGAGYAANAQSQFEDALDSGANLDEAVRSARLAGLMGTSEVLPISNLLNRLDKGTGGSITRAIKEALKQGSEEAIQEAMQTTWSNLIASDLVEYDPERRMFTGAGEAAGVGFTVGSLLTTMGFMVTGGYRKLRGMREQTEVQNEAEQVQIDALNEKFSENQMREIDKGSFKQFVEQADGENNTHVFVDGSQAALYLQEKTPEEINADPALKLLSEQVREAAQLDTDVQIPVADFAADIAGTEHFDALRESMTLSEEGVSPFRQEQVKQERDSYLQRLMQTAEENASEYVESQQIADTVKQQLIDTGVYTPQAANQIVELMPAYFASKAQREGITVAEAYEKFGFTVEGPMTGERARLQAEGVLEQEPVEYVSSSLGVEARPPAFGPEFDDVIGQKSEIVFDDAVVQLSVREDSDATQVTGIAAKQPDNLAEVVEGTGRGTQVLEQLKARADATGKRLNVVDVTTAAKPFYEKIEWLTEEQVTLDFEGEPYTPPISFTYVPQRATLGLEQPGVPTDEATRQELERGREQREARQAAIEAAKGRNDEEALAEFNRAAEGQTVTFVHRSFDDFTKFDDTLLGTNTTTPSGNLGHYLSAADVGNVDRYGNEVSVHEFTLQNPLIIKADVFESVTEGMTPEQATERRQQLIDMGHDGILVEGVNWAIVFESDTLSKLEEDTAALDDIVFEQPVSESPVVDISYRIEHTAPTPEGANSADDASDIYPDDVYDPSVAWRFYGHGGDTVSIDKETAQILSKLQGSPDTEVTIYRAVPKGITNINAGDWVTINKNYADLHGGAWVDDGRYDVIEKVVKASEIHTDGNSIHEWGYNPEGVVFEQPSRQQQPRGYYSPSESVIRLTEASDLTSFLHEFAHFMYEMELTGGDSDLVNSIHNWYKRNAEEVAKEANSYLGDEYDAEKQGELEPDGKVITEDDVTTYLDSQTTGDNDKDAAIRRAVHEQFARGFELYLKEGKAPSIELRNVFRTFARWMARIYADLKQYFSNVKLDDEMRQVFDRLLATEEQLRAAEARANVEPMFTDAAMAGMTDEEFADYQKRQEKVKDIQSETLRDKLIKEMVRKTKAWWKEEKQDLIDEETERLERQQVYVARAQLRDGDMKLDHATVKEMAGELRTDRLGRTSVVIPPALVGMTKKGQEGIHPDEAAAFLGYESGSQMLHDLITAPKIEEAAEVAAEARMIDRHGDMLNDGSIQREADEAVQNEERGKLILHELKMLSRDTTVPKIDRQMIKQVAAERIGRLSFREIHPGKYRKAEVRAAQEASRMLAEGNKEGAAQAKVRQVMNYYLGMAATEAKNETMKIVDFMGRYRKKKVREEVIKAGQDYWDQLATILHRFEFRKSATLTEVESLNLWVKQKVEEMGDGLVISAAVLDEGYRTHWKNVPYDDLQGVKDSVKNIEHVARYGNKIRLANEELDFKKLKNSWVEHIQQQDERFKTKKSRSRLDDAREATAMEHIRRWASQLTKVPFLASWLDGGERSGMSHDILVQQFTDALDAKMRMVDEVAAPVLELINNRSREDMKRHNRKIYIPEIQDNLAGHQILAVALNTGNQSNLKKLLLGEGWADPENEAEITFNNPKLQAVLSHMTKSDWEMVQKIWDQMELLYPQLAEVHRRTTGLVPPKVEATPIVNQYGTFRGGYYPVKYSPKRSHRAAKNEEKREAEVESLFNNTASIQASVSAGATNERTGFYDRIYLSLEVVPDHFNETIHYITHHDAVRQVNRLIQSPDVADAISGVLGEDEYNQLKPWLNDVAKDGRQQPVKTYVDSIFQRLRFGTTIGVMGFKASTGIMQLFGLFTTAAEVGPSATLKGVMTTIGHSWYMKAIRKTLGSTDDMQTAWDFAAERSKVLQHRTTTMDREIRNAMDRLRGKRGVIPAVQEVSMKHIALIQTYMVDLSTWHAVYEKEISESNDEAKAIKRADWSVENLQGSGATKDMATILRNQSKIHTTFTMFMTFFSSLGNLSRDLVKGVRTSRYSMTSAAAKTMFLFTIPVFMEMLMRGEFDDEDDDERMSRFVTATALYPLQSVPFIRDAAGGVFGDYGYNISPVASMLEKGLAGYKQITERAFTDEDITKSAAKGATKLTAAALGIPGVNQMWATGEHLNEVIEDGEDVTVRELLFGPDRE